MIKKFITLLLMIIIPLQMTGCKNISNEDSEMPTKNYSKEEKEAIQAIDDTINAIKNGDVSFFEELYPKQETSENSIDASREIIILFKPIAENVQYSYISTEKLDNDSVNVNIEFTMPDPESLKDSEYIIKFRQSLLLGLLGEDLKNVSHENEKAYKEYLNSNPQTVKKEVSCLVKRDENAQWKLDDDSFTVILDNITGNIATILDAMEQ